VNKFLGMTIDLAATASPIFVNVKGASLHRAYGWWWQVDFVFHRLPMIRKLKLRMIDTVELPEHPNEVGLTAKHLANNDTRTVAQRLPSKMFASEDALGLDKLLVEFR